jgi:hypothetical protein
MNNDTSLRFSSRTWLRNIEVLNGCWRVDLYVARCFFASSTTCSCAALALVGAALNHDVGRWYGEDMGDLSRLTVMISFLTLCIVQKIQLLSQTPKNHAVYTHGIYTNKDSRTFQLLACFQSLSLVMCCSRAMIHANWAFRPHCFLISGKNGPVNIESVKRGIMRTSNAMLTQHMRSLYLPAGGTSVEVFDVLQSFTGHLPVSLLHVWCLLLGYSSENRVPDIG